MIGTAEDRSYDILCTHFKPSTFPPPLQVTTQVSNMPFVKQRSTTIWTLTALILWAAVRSSSPSRTRTWRSWSFCSTTASTQVMPCSTPSGRRWWVLWSCCCHTGGQAARNRCVCGCLCMLWIDLLICCIQTVNLVFTFTHLSKCCAYVCVYGCKCVW